MKVSISLNDTVKVKLTDEGVLFLKQRHDEINKKIRENGGRGCEFALKLDENGYYQTQLWSLVETFKERIDICFKPVFDINDIQIIK